MTADITDVAIAWGLRCPRCGQSDEIDIAAMVWVRLCPDGTDPTLAANGDHEWSNHHGACCNACGFCAHVGDFQIAESGGGAS